MTNLKQALKDVASDLSSFAASKNFWSVFGDVFGTGYSKPAAHAIQAQLSRGDLSQLARVEVVSASLLGRAQAAYASANGTIYLSERFLAQASLPQLKAALLEEIGHAIDARVNASDRPGDEGELFSLLVRGITPAASERQRMLAEDDRRTITINGVTLQVEQAAPVVYETTNVGFASSGLYGYKISGTNAIWTEAKGANRTLRFFNGTSSSTIANSVYSDFGDIAISGATVAYTKSDGQDLEVYRSSAGVTTRLTTNTNRDGNLLIDGNTIVWQSYDAMGTGDIYRNNGTTTTRITTNTVQEEDVQLSGSQLLWAASDGNDYEIYLNDGITTRALTNNTLDDYSPVLSGNRAAWFQWNNNQENLFFYDGSTAKQITTNLDISDPLFAGSNLVYKQTNASGTTSLKFYNATTGTTSQLSANLGSWSFTQVAASGNLVAWLESGGDSGSVGPMRSTLKLFNGSTTTTIATNVLQSGSSGKFALRGSKIFYLGSPDNNNYSGELYLYDAASSTPASTQLTVGESDYQIQALGVNGNRILWTDGSALKLTQPSTKPVISFSSPSFSVVEGFTSPQNASLSVTLSAASSVPVTVRYETFTSYNNPNPAYPGSDYTQTTGTLTFAAGVTSQAINVPIINDTYLESDKTFSVRLLEPSNAVLVPGQNTATITISDTWQTTGANGSTFTLPAGVENLTLTGGTNIIGAGNANNNEIRGNSGNNTLSGGGGYDRLIGGLGNDTYVVSKSSSFEPSPQITENANEGTDTVEFTSTASSDSYSLFDNNLENLIIKGSGNHSGYGNDGNNVISGNSGNNYLSGNGGIDTVSYAAAPGPAGVTVSLTNPFGFGGGSASGWGTDTLNGFENIIGSGFNDTLSGDSASNTITGNAGKDTITGNGGSDKFDYRTLSHSALATFDRITDFDATTTGDRFLVSTARAGFHNGGQVSTLVTDAALTAAAISTKLTTTNFLANFAATITMGSGVTSRTFVVINNTVAGYSAVDDALVEVTGFSGSFSGTSQFVTS